MHSPIKLLIKYCMLHIFINCAGACFYVNSSSYPSWFALSDVFSPSICILLIILNISCLNYSLDMDKSLMWFYSFNCKSHNYSYRKNCLIKKRKVKCHVTDFTCSSFPLLFQPKFSFWNYLSLNLE